MAKKWPRNLPELLPGTKTKREERRALVIYDVYRDGHRRDYFRVLRRVLGGQVVSGPFARHWLLLLRANKIVCSTCDDYLLAFFLLATARAFFGRQTVGLSVRAETIFQRAGLAQAVKRVIFRTLKLLPNAKLITFMPYWAELKLEKFTNDWMYDIQFWDLPWLGPPPSDSLALQRTDLRTQAAGRRIVASIGHQRQVKGVEYFLQIFCAQAEVRGAYLFVCIGPNWDISRALVDRFVACGGVFMNRQLRDDELVPAYALADLIWVCYRPDYDQSSGIFGRAIQLGLQTVVREGSYLFGLQARLGFGGVAIPYDQADTAGAALLSGVSNTSAGALARPERTNDFLCNLLGVENRQPRSEVK